MKALVLGLVLISGLNSQSAFSDSENYSSHEKQLLLNDNECCIQVRGITFCEETRTEAREACNELLRGNNPYDFECFQAKCE